MFKGAIFDLDGVIVNTVPLHFKAWKRMFAEYGIDFSFEDYKAKVDGIPRYDGAKAILTHLSDSQIKEAGDRKQNYFLEFIEKEAIPVYNSSLGLIEELKKYNIKVAIASSSRNCKRILQKVGIIHLADAVVGGNDFSRGKPDPQIFQLAAQILECDYSECVVFEDALLGIEAAVNGKMICIGVDRYDDPERLTRANLVVRDLKEVNYKALKELFGK
jgi:beta-phosphoglucomutase